MDSLPKEPERYLDISLKSVILPHVFQGYAVISLRGLQLPDKSVYYPASGLTYKK
jgi:hypothetical protein